MPTTPNDRGPAASEALRWLRAAMRAERPRLAVHFTSRATRCGICHRRLDDGTPESINCGGDCMACMADVAGDPDAVAILRPGVRWRLTYHGQRMAFPHAPWGTKQ